MFTQSKRRPLVVSFAAVAFVSLSILILGMVMVARIGKVPPIADLPQDYLPGRALPKDAVCRDSGDSLGYACDIDYFGKKTYFTTKTNTAMIISTTVGAREHTVGELIAAWGIPTGIIQNSHYTSVYWGTWRTRSAFLTMNRPFQPGSQVESIIYTLEPPQSSPWRGFMSIKH